MSAIQGTPPLETTAPPPALNLAKVLQQMLGVSSKVSDLIFSPGRPPQVELVSKLQGVSIPGLEKLTPAQTYAIAKVIIGNHENSIESLEKYGSADLSFGVPGLSRFRVNIFKQRGTYAIVMRVIPGRPPRFEDFNLPDQLRQIVELKNGIVLVTGPTGSGKSSSLAAVIDLIRAANEDLGTTVVLVTHDPAIGRAMGRTVTIRDGRVGAEGHAGEEYLVVGRDGSIQLPPDLLDVLPPGSLARAIPTADGVELRRADTGRG